VGVVVLEEEVGGFVFVDVDVGVAVTVDAVFSVDSVIVDRDGGDVDSVGKEVIALLRGVSNF